MALFRFNKDSDRDGFSDRTEVKVGTDPKDASSFPRPELLAGLHRWSVDGAIYDTRIDMDLPYTVDELDTGLPNMFRHIIDISIEIAYSAV